MKNAKIKAILKLALSFILNFVCVIFIFVSGAFSFTTLRENVASNISTLAGDNYINIYQKEIGGMKYFDRNNISDWLQVVIKENNSYYSHNMFQSGITYGLDSADIKIDSLNINNNIVFLLSGIFSNHINTNNQIILDSYYLELMFEEANSSHTGYDNFCYITKQQADYLIKNNYNYNSYEDLLNQSIAVEIDQKIYNWKISNIIIPFGEYYEGCVKIFNNFMLCYINLPTYSYVSMSHFYLNDTKFNFFKINDTISFYKNDALEFHIYQSNLRNLEICNNITMFFNGTISSNLFAFVPLFILSVALIIINFIYLHIINISKHKKAIILFSSSFLSYAIFYLYFKITNSILYFSFFSTMYLLCFLLVSILYFLYLFLLRGKND